MLSSCGFLLLWVPRITHATWRRGNAEATVSAQMGTITDLGAAQAASTYDTRDFQTKAISKMKVFKGDEKAWSDWRDTFRVEASRNFRQAIAILDSS